MYLTTSDISALVPTKVVEAIALSFGSAIMKTAERYALDEAKSYLNFKYDTVLIFSYEAFDYDQQIAYKEGQVIVDSDAVGYTCIQDAPAATALTDSAYFELGDPRNPILVMIVVDLMVYHFFSRLPQNQTPQKQIDRYEQALKKLKEIRKSIINPDLPLKVFDEEANNSAKETHTIKIISKPKRENFW